MKEKDVVTLKKDNSEELAIYPSNIIIAKKNESEIKILAVGHPNYITFGCDEYDIESLWNGLVGRKYYEK